jgi:hypothetical protein
MCNGEFFQIFKERYTLFLDILYDNNHFIIVILYDRKNFKMSYKMRHGDHETGYNKGQTHQYPPR